MRRLPLALIAISGLFGPALFAPPSQAGEFTILPLRVELDRVNRATEVVIRNDDKAPLRMQAQAMAWRQNADGKDVYEPADGLIFFPRALEIPPGDSRIVRVGVRAAPVAQEEAYRLFLEELPPPSLDSAPSGASVRILLRIGVPVFVAPAQIVRKAAISGLEVKGGRVRWTVANEGSVHLIADRIEVTLLARDGTSVDARQVQERYFLAGATRSLQSELPPEICARAAAVEVSIVGENLDLRNRVDVEPSACR
jgi:fimbrial chaperone protein